MSNAIDSARDAVVQEVEMQAVVVLPDDAGQVDARARDRLLFRRVAGVPLMTRVLATAQRAGIRSVLLVRPSDLSESWLVDRLSSPLIDGLSIRIVPTEGTFDSRRTEDWARLEPFLAPVFLWLPWNLVMPRRAMNALAAMPPIHGAFDPAAPAVMPAHLVLGRSTAEDVVPEQAVPPPPPAAVAVDSRDTARQAERLLVRGSGKPSDGIYSNFNRRLCRPLVRALLNTPVTANMVTYAGVPVTLVSAYLYAQGTWSAYVAGALVYFFSVLLDEVDGMIARTKFQDSAFGCWLETATDYASYLFLWVGMSVGLTRQYDSPVWLGFGGLTIVMSLLIFVVLVRMRKTVATESAPDQFHYRFNGSLEADAASAVSRGVRKISFLAKRGVMAHYVVIFSVFGLLPLFVALAALGSVIALAISVYTNRLFLSRPAAGPAV